MERARIREKQKCLRVEEMNDPQSEDRPSKTKKCQRIYRMCLFENVFIFSMEIKNSHHPFSLLNLHSVMYIKLSISKCVTNSIKSKHDTPFHTWYIWHVTTTSKNMLYNFNQTLSQCLSTCLLFHWLFKREISQNNCEKKDCSLWI